MRQLHQAAPSKCRCTTCHSDVLLFRSRKQVAAMIAALGGIDLLVFTGGIGEK
jgi:acetate kinase